MGLYYIAIIYYSYIYVYRIKAKMFFRLLSLESGITTGNNWCKILSLFHLNL